MTDIETNTLALRSVNRNHKRESSSLHERHVVEGEGPHCANVRPVGQTVRPTNGEVVAEWTFLKHRLPIFVLEVNRQGDALICVGPRDTEPEADPQAVMPRWQLTHPESVPAAAHNEELASHSLD